MEELLKLYGVSSEDVSPYLIWSNTDYFNALPESIRDHAKLLNALHIKYVLANPSFGASSVHEGDLSLTFSESQSSETVFSRLLKQLLASNASSLGIAVSPYVGTSL